jgi:hypothetical protein
MFVLSLVHPALPSSFVFVGCTLRPTFSTARKRVMQEIELLQKLQHRNIVAFLGKEILDKVPFSPFGPVATWN